MSQVELHHMPPSFYSQIARIALVEKGVEWLDCYSVPGPPGFEAYQGWYMKLNPGGTVPTLVHEGRSVPDSMLIARYVDENFEGPALIPEDEGERVEMERWFERLAEISIRNLTYSNPRLDGVGRFLNGRRIAALRKNKRKNPDMEEVYNAKIRDIESFMMESTDRELTTKTRARVVEILDELEEVLKGRLYLAGESYSLADAIWTVGVARLKMLKMSPLEGRPMLGAWYGRMKARPSFEKANIWEKFQPGQLLPLLAKKLWPQLTVLFLLLGVGLWWWLGR